MAQPLLPPDLQQLHSSVNKDLLILKTSEIVCEVMPFITMIVTVVQEHSFDLRFLFSLIPCAVALVYSIISLFYSCRKKNILYYRATRNILHMYTFFVFCAAILNFVLSVVTHEFIIETVCVCLLFIYYMFDLRLAGSRRVKRVYRSTDRQERGLGRGRRDRRDLIPTARNIDRRNQRPNDELFDTDSSSDEDLRAIYLEESGIEGEPPRRILPPQLFPGVARRGILIGLRPEPVHSGRHDPGEHFEEGYDYPEGVPMQELQAPRRAIAGGSQPAPVHAGRQRHGEEHFEEEYDAHEDDRRLLEQGPRRRSSARLQERAESRL